MAIIIGDIHGDLAMARLFLGHRPGDLHIALGDLVDSRRKLDFQEESACLDLLLGSDAVLMWGNHDLSYLPETPWRCFGNFGPLAFRDKYQENRLRFVAAYAVDGWLLTHAGVSPRLAKLIPPGILAGGPERIARWLNEEFEKEIRMPAPAGDSGRFGHGPLFNVPLCRGGYDAFGGIFWHDAEGEQSQPSPEVGPQIFGHSPVPVPERGHSRLSAGPGSGREGPSWINLDATQSGVWIYDTASDTILDLAQA